MSRAVPPAADAVEVSLLGPGFGEAVLVHVGGGDWICVDSCVDRDGQSLPLQYLAEIGVEPKSVKLIVITHFDDDHIRGSGALVQDCRKAKVATSAAFCSEEFRALVYTVVPRSMMRWPGLAEFQTMYDAMVSRGCGFKLSAEDRLLLRRRQPPEVTVYALSPSDKALEAALGGFAAMIPEPRASRRRLPAPSRNEGSVALWIRIGDITVLLGADVLASTQSTRGWQAILGATSWRGDPVAGIHKVAHHGGYSGHDDAVWAEMLGPEPIAMLTPWRLAGNYLPSADDCARICGLTPRAYTTAPNDEEKPSSADPPILRGMIDAALSVRDAWDGAGHIRARRAFSDPEWTVELFGGASVLCDVSSAA